MVSNVVVNSLLCINNVCMISNMYMLHPKTNMFYQSVVV